MTASHITLNVPAAQVEAPRGALLVGAVAGFFINVLAARKARIARRQLERDTVALRELAHSLRDTAPSLAADLAAAADRAL